MSNTTEQLQLPDRMRLKLEHFQKRIWLIKFLEGAGAALFGLLVSYLVVFGLERVIETTAWTRGLILVGGSLGLAIWFPLVCHRWIWKSRRLEQVARMLKVNHPRLGDYLLGIIELVHSEDRKNTSEALCRAALEQADKETADKDFSKDVPRPRHKFWLGLAGVPLALGLALLILVPEASLNSLTRWLMPWSEIDRYTFVRIQQLPNEVVVPLSEPSVFDARLDETSRWRPESGSAWLGSHQIDADVDEDRFEFQLPPLKSMADLNVRIGDVVKQVRINPQARPELKSLAATIQLPAYLQRAEPVSKSIRGGGLAIVEGANYAVSAEATRSLVMATVNDQPVSVQGATIRTSPLEINGETVLELSWQDGLGLSAKMPLRLKVRSAADEAPNLACRDLTRKRIIMVKDVLSFQLDVSDDYGVKTVGMEWRGRPAEDSASTPAIGEKVIFAGNPTATEVEQITATFSPVRENIEPQLITLRLFAEDYLPDRPRVYSLPYQVFVLTEDEHAIWMTRRLDEWFKQSLETYEREQQLFKRNQQLRDLSPEELDRPEIRRQIEAQAKAERRQARKLASLTEAGAELVEEAARNDKFGVAHLEKLAEMIQELKDIEANRMPSVADLLKEAADAAASSPQDASSQPESKEQSGEQSEQKPGEANPKNSIVDDPGIDKPGNDSAEDQDEADENEADSDEKEDDPPKAPSITLKESSMEPESEKEQGSEERGGSASPGKLTIPSVTLDDPNKKEGEACPAGQKMQQAVEAQEDLLAEFQKVAEELQQLIGDLEGSTFVKRLKAMSRRELVMANDIQDSTLSGFGSVTGKLRQATLDRMNLLARRQEAHVATLETIQEDLEAYANRVQQGKFKTVLAEMKEMEILSQAKSVAVKISSNVPGTSIAHSEFLADTFDRWAEQLVGPG